MSRLKIAAYSAAGCGGCDIALLDIHEHILALADAADIVFWPAATDFKYSDVEALADGEIDACFFNGAIRTEENAQVARLLRAKSKVLVAFGACAAMGGVPGLSNFFSAEDTLARVFGTESTDAGSLPPRSGHSDTESLVPALTGRVSQLSGVVAVDLELPGCPPEAPRVWEVCQALVAGAVTVPGSDAAPAVVGAGTRSVCDECSRPKRGVRVAAFKRPHQIVPEPDWCLLEQGLVCMGPATRSGCGARCTSAAMPCRGCYGPAGDSTDQGAAMAAALGTVVDSEDESVIIETVSAIADPAGTFYCFSLPSSILGGARRAKEVAE